MCSGIQNIGVGSEESTSTAGNNLTFSLETVTDDTMEWNQPRERSFMQSTKLKELDIRPGNAEVEICPGG